MDMLASKKMTDPIDCLYKATFTSSRHLRRSEVLRSLRHELWVQSQDHSNDHLDGRGMENGSSQQSSSKDEMTFINQMSNIGAVSKSKALLGKLLKDGVEHIA